MTEARVKAPAAQPPVTAVADGATTQGAEPAADRLEVLREFERQGGLSRERREALRVLLRHDRQLDLTNPWSD
jgi:hypothetical protein